jgi:hydrogenase maturation factor
MCRSTIGRVVEVADGWAVVDLEGVDRRASALLIPDLRAGERVLVGLGTVLARVDDADVAALQALQDGRPVAPSPATLPGPDRRS